MENKLAKYTLIAEVVSSIAIIATLFILIIEVRENTELARLSAYDNVSKGFDEDRVRFLTEPEIFEQFHKMNNGELPDIDLDSVERLKTVVFLLNQFTGIERAYLSYKAGVFGEGEWKRVERSACVMWQIIQESVYLAPVSFRLTDDYVSHLNMTCTPEYVEELNNRYYGTEN